MQVPKISHMQFATLGLLRGGPRAGKAVREGLAALGLRKTGAGFYQLMARMEEAGLVEGRYVSVEFSGRTYREREYRLTQSGASAWRTCDQFYRTVSLSGGESWAPS